MPTVIDSLIVELGLDPSKFTEGQKKAGQAFLKTKEEAVRTAKDIEARAKLTAGAISHFRNQLIGLYSLFTAGKGIKQFLTDITNSDASLGRLARILDTSVSNLAAWQGAARRVGGSAAGMAGSMKSLIQQFQTFSMTGESSVIPYLRALQINMTKFLDNKGNLVDVSGLLLELADKFSHMDPARAAAFGSAMGFDEGTINLLLRGRDAVHDLLEEQKKLNPVVKQNTDNAAKLYEQWAKFAMAAESAGRTILNKLAPPLTWVLKQLQWIAEGFSLGPSFDGKGVRNINEGSTALTDDEAEAYIREAAKKRGMDPDIAVRVARSEGLGKGYAGDQGSSFGPFQLHRGGIAPGGNAVSGLGDLFMKQTGEDPADPRTVMDQIDFALDQAQQNGWGPWHGWKGSAFAGIPTTVPQPGSFGDQTPSSTVHNDTKIGTIVVNTKATDAHGIAKDIGPAMERNNLAAQANTGATGSF